MNEAAGSLRGLAGKVWQLFDAEEKRACVSVVALSIVAACLTLVGVAGIAPFFAVLADPAVVERSDHLVWLRQALAIETSQGLLVLLGVGFVVLLSLANLANLFALLSIGRFSQRVGARLHSVLFEEYLKRGLSFHARSNSSLLTTRVIQDVTRTVGGVIQSGLTLCSSAASIALIAGAVIVVDPLIAAAAVVLLCASYALIYAFVRRRLAQNGGIVTNHWNARAQIIAESFAAIRDVIVHRAQPKLVARVQRHSAAIATAYASTLAIATAPKYLLECVTAAGLVAVALWVYGRAGAADWLTHLAFLGFAAYRLLPAVQQLFAAIARVHAERSAFESIAEDLRSAQWRTLMPDPVLLGGDWNGRPRRAIRLIDVSYRHSPRGGGVSGISLEIAAGTLVGFVGPNGAGKSTLAELVLGLLSPDAGRLEVDGIELRPCNQNAWLDTVAYVPQQIVLIDGSIAQNIAFDFASGEPDLPRVREAATAAQLDAFLATLPDGLATMIGENGAQLSGGQRQRVALARALYRRASLLVVDEATNALDALTEAEVLTLLRALRRDCTIIVIAHRASSLAGCDLVFELDEGRLAGRRTAASGAPLRESASR